MGTITVTIEIPGKTEADANALKAKLATVPEIPGNARVSVSYASGPL